MSARPLPDASTRLPAARPSSDEGGAVPRSSLTVAALSTVVEWYDFSLYLFMATVVSRVFFDGGTGSVLATLALFAVAYLMRPLGALVFGHLGDRRGRRTTLLVSMSVMTLAMLATAVLPTHEQVGGTAVVLLLVLRCAMGFAVGGEYSAVMAYLVESARPGRRGLVASLAASASEVGALLAVAVAALTTSLLSQDQVDSWGWRLPFLVGALLGLTTLVARLSLRESPEFERVSASGAIASAPLRTTLTSQRPALVRAFTISAFGSVTYYVGIGYVPVFLVAVAGLSEGGALQLATVASVAVILVTPIAGWLSDRVGRRRVLVALALVSTVVPLLTFSAMARGGGWLTLWGAVALALLAGGVSAVGASAAPEQFPVRTRLSALGIATVATTIFGGFTPYVSQTLIAATGLAVIPGALVAVVALVALPVLWHLPETADLRRP